MAGRQKWFVRLLACEWSLYGGQSFTQAIPPARIPYSESVQMQKYNELTQEEKSVIEDKGTEMPFTGEYDDFFVDGTFICRRCNAPLFSSKSKFDAHCGWPTFDENFPDAVKRLTDADGIRTEIDCANCGAHLGHVFEGEQFTETNTRHCVNSVSIKFVPKDQELPEIIKV